MVQRVQRKKLILWLALVGVQVFVCFITYFVGQFDSYNKYKLYVLPFGETATDQQLFFFILAMTLPYLAIIIGFGLSYIVVIIYMRLIKLNKRFEFIGFSKVIQSEKLPKRRYLIHIIFGVLLSLNIWMIILGSDYLGIWVAEEYKDIMYDESGKLNNFPMVPWYWVPIFITTLMFALCSAIIDSGLVTVKKIPEHKMFSDTERVGDKIFGIVKGYAGISVILSFILILQTPLGREMSLVLYPILILIFLFPMIIAIDLLKDIGRRLIYKAIKSKYEPQLISLTFEKIKLTDRNEIYR